MKSIGQMIEALNGLSDTKDVTPWENEFIKSIHEKYLAARKVTTDLSSKQVDAIETIYSKHFG